VAGATVVFLDSAPCASHDAQRLLHGGPLGVGKLTYRAIDWWGGDGPGAWGYARAPLVLHHSYLDGLPQGCGLEVEPTYRELAPKGTWHVDWPGGRKSLDQAVVEVCLHVPLPYSLDLGAVHYGK